MEIRQSLRESEINSKALLKTAREGSVQSFADALRDTGSAILANAVETFCRMDREGDQGVASVEHLKNLKNAVIAHLKRAEEGLKSNHAGAEKLEEAVSGGRHPEHRLQPETTITVTDAVARNGRTYEYLERWDKAEVSVLHLPAVDDMRGLKGFLKDLTAVQGLYTAAVILPGPLALSLKNFAKETATGQFTASSVAGGESYQHGLIRHAGSAFSESSQAQGSSRYEKVTVDERVVPVLTELQDRLAQASVSPASNGYLSADHHWRDTYGHKPWYSCTVKYDGVAAYTLHDKDRTQRKLEDFEYQPERVRLPETSISDYAKS